MRNFKLNARQMQRLVLSLHSFGCDSSNSGIHGIRWLVIQVDVHCPRSSQFPPSESVHVLPGKSVRLGSDHKRLFLFTRCDPLQYPKDQCYPVYSTHRDRRIGRPETP